MTKQVQMSPAQLQAHARDLAQAFGARLIESDQLKPEEAFAIGQSLRCAFVHTVIDETTYAVALHELGHLVAPVGNLRGGQVAAVTHNVKRDEEDAAWKWARHYALVWTPAMEAVAQWAEGTYAPKPPVAAPQAPAVPKRQEINWKEWK